MRRLALVLAVAVAACGASAPTAPKVPYCGVRLVPITFGVGAQRYTEYLLVPLRCETAEPAP